MRVVIALLRILRLFEGFSWLWDLFLTSVAQALASTLRGYHVSLIAVAF